MVNSILPACSVAPYASWLSACCIFVCAFVLRLLHSKAPTLREELFEVLLASIGGCSVSQILIFHYVHFFS
ncbi:hypothetical protein BS78_01G476900 [Paspalum vaginatum]|nr:hypothetical protein BS78_01G476900 [Paspalum vaginatum]KAJ1298742.1 hypothetical protein BS78_01G476900 [Paspalum vaginatum]KAJ1298743.1 hypothetical protein BS78_01G476900 [Paspalum vaginatum]